MNTEKEILRATTNDINSVAEILGEAFYDDPVVSHIVGREGLAGDLFEASFQYLYAPLDHSFYVTNEANEAMGCALWAKPGQQSSPSLRPLLKLGWTLLSRAGGKALMRGMKVADFVDIHHLKEPHYYLHAIGVKRAFQGQGVGGSLLAHGLAIADRDQMPTFLENSKERNLPIYQKYGFEVIAKKNLPDNGPPMWFMRRSPRQQQLSSL